jgi:phosphoglycolate phosphatase
MTPEPTLRAAPVVFDLDGTLVDSRQDLAEAVNRTRAGIGLPPLDLDTVVPMVGEGAPVLLRKALAVSGAGERAEELFPTFMQHYLAGCLDHTRLYPGMRRLLVRLAPRRPLAVLTNKPEVPTRRVLDGLGLDGLLPEVVAGDTLPTKKPDPAGLRHLAGRFERPVEELVLVGDSGVDAATAEAAGCRCVLVGWGFTPPGELGQQPAFARVDTVDELVGVLEAL